MKHKTSILLVLLLLAGFALKAQKPFSEGTIVYNVTMQSADGKQFSGVYTYTFKGPQIKKELSLNNGYQEVMLYNTANNTIYTLQNRNGKKYAIQLSMDDLHKKQQRFTGFSLKNEESDKRRIAGMSTHKANISYADGTGYEVYYTKDWCPAQSITFDRFPNAKFLPMYYSYKDENNVTMHVEAEKVEPRPIDNAVFRIPPDYKMISYEEYRQLSR